MSRLIEGRVSDVPLGLLPRLAKLLLLIFHFLLQLFYQVFPLPSLHLNTFQINSLMNSENKVTFV